MLVWISFVEISTAQVAEMGITFEANHMIASMRLLSSGVTCWARLRMKLHVVFGRLFFDREFILAAGEAGEVFAMPARFADFAKSEIAVFADCEAFGWGREFLLGVITVIGLRFLSLFRFLGFFLLLSLAFADTSWSLTPLARAVYRRSIRFEAFLPLQLDITLYCILLQRYL